MTLPDFTDRLCNDFIVSATLPLTPKEFGALRGARSRKRVVGYCWETKQNRGWVHCTVVLDRDSKDKVHFRFSMGRVDRDHGQREQTPVEFEKLLNGVVALGKEAAFHIRTNFCFPSDVYKTAIGLPAEFKGPAPTTGVESQIVGVRIAFSGVSLKWVIVDVDEDENEIQVTVQDSITVGMSEQFVTKALEQASAIGRLFVNQKA